MSTVIQYPAGMSNGFFIKEGDSVIAVAGAPRRELLEKRCSQELERLMEARRNYRAQEGESPVCAVDGLERYRVGVAAPILAGGDLMGCVLLLLACCAGAAGLAFRAVAWCLGLWA